MEASIRTVRSSFRVARVCRQCRQVSSQAGTRYSSQTATRGLADDVGRISPKQGAPSKPDQKSVSSARWPTSIDDAPAQAPSIFDMLSARATSAPPEPPFSGKDLEFQMKRQFAAGDVYSPHDLTGVEQGKWDRYYSPPRTKLDAADRLGIDFLREYKNISMMQEFVTSAGRIVHSKTTKLRPVNQRRLARAIRRAQGIGLIPKTYRHPELLMRIGR